MGHSVGSWLLCQVMKREPEAVEAGYMLFPTIGWIEDTWNGRTLWVRNSLILFYHKAKLIKMCPADVPSTLSVPDMGVINPPSTDPTFHLLPANNPIPPPFAVNDISLHQYGNLRDEDHSRSGCRLDPLTMRR